MLEVRDIHKNFGGIKALGGVSLEARRGHATGLIGPNGSGKTTLFNIISGFYAKDTGEVLFKGERIDNLPPYAIASKGLCRTFQISKAPARMTVLENMLLASTNGTQETVLAGLFKRGRRSREQRKDLEKASELLSLVGLSHLANEYAGNLSGGQRKLLSLARVLMRNPELILLDEPTAGVNPTLAKNLLEFIKRLRLEKNMTFLIVEHNMKIVSEVCDMVYVLDAGRIIFEGEPTEAQKDERVLRAYLGKNTNPQQRKPKEDQNGSPGR